MEGMTLSRPGKCHRKSCAGRQGRGFWGPGKRPVRLEPCEQGRGWYLRRLERQAAARSDSALLPRQGVLLEDWWRRKQWAGVSPICLTRRPPRITLPSRNSHVFVHPSSHWVFSNCLLCFRLECTRRYGSQPLRDGLGRKTDNQLVQCSVITAMSKKVEVVWKQLEESPVQPGGGCQRKLDEGSGVKQRTRLALLWGRWCLGFLLFVWACLALAVTFWRLIYLFLIFKKNVFTYK